jgi:hypothetical protein
MESMTESMIDNKVFRIAMTGEQRGRLLALLGRVPLKGAEAGAFLEIFNLIKKAPVEGRPMDRLQPMDRLRPTDRLHPRPALGTIQQPIKP